MGELFLLNRCVTGKIRFQLLKKTNVYNTGTTHSSLAGGRCVYTAYGYFYIKLGRLFSNVFVDHDLKFSICHNICKPGEFIQE